MKIYTLEEVMDRFTFELQNMYRAESEYIATLPIMVESTDRHEIRKGLRENLLETIEHTIRLMQVGNALHIVVKGHLRKVGDLVQMRSSKERIDKTLLTYAHTMERYKYEGYKNLLALAHQLNLDVSVKQLLEQSFQEVAATNRKFMGLAGATAIA